MNNNSTEKRMKLSKIIPIATFSLCGIILLIKCFYGFCWSDETFYISTAYRFFSGDSVFKHEWFPSQLSGVLLLPFMAIYILIVGSASGIILYFRILYVIFALISAITVYTILSKDKSGPIAMVSAVCTLFYSHLNIATLSYYTISFHCFLLSMLLLYHFCNSKANKHLIISGVLFGLSVLALPTLAVAYFVILFVIFALLFILKLSFIPNNFRKMYSSIEPVRIVIFTFMGIVIPAVAFLFFLLTNVSVPDFINAIPYVLSDEEHVTSIIFPIRKFFIGINEVYGKYAYIGYLLILLTFILNKRIKKPIKQFIFLFDIVLFVIYSYFSFGHTGYIQTAICLFALPLFFITERKDVKAFFTFFSGGMIFALVYSYSSNGFLYVLSIGHFIASIGAIIFVCDFTQELVEDNEINPLMEQKIYRPIVITVSMLILAYVSLTTVTLRITNIYRDAPLGNLSVKITQGPARGLYTTAEHDELYRNVYNTITNECQSSNLGKESGYIFITKLLPFGYMCTDLKCAAPTTWRTQFNSARLKPYYNMNPDRTPDMILVLNDNYGCYDTCGDVEADPIPNANELGGFLQDYVQSNNFTQKKVPCGSLYISDFSR